MQGKNCRNRIIGTERRSERALWNCDSRTPGAVPGVRDTQNLRIPLPLAVVSVCLAALVGYGAPQTDRTPCDNPTSAWTGTTGPMLSNPGVVAAFDLAVDGDGNVLLAGDYWGTADLDPTDALDEHSSVGSDDAFVTKVNSDGSYAWTYAVGGPEYDGARSLAVAENACVLVGGSYQGTVDFDPTDGIDERTAVGDYNVFLTKLTSEGAYLWTLTFGEGDEDVGASKIGLDGQGNILIVGSYCGTADFDPGEGTDLHSALISRDVFVTKLDSDGAYGWTRTFGGTGYDRGTGIGLDPDGNIFVTGTFRGTVDFDPTDGVDWHSMVPPYEDVFVTKLHPDGSYAWTRTYDPWLSVQGGPIAVGPDGGAVIGGAFRYTVDFDPTDEEDLRTSVGETSDLFVTKVYTDGSYAWTYTVGGPSSESAEGVAVDLSGTVFITGYFNDTVDFDPGPTSDPHSSMPRADIFVTVLQPDGSYGWTRTFGGPGTDGGKHVAVDAYGGVIVGGSFRTIEETGPADFDPGCELDEHGVHCYGAPDNFITKLVCVEPTPDFDADGDVDLRDFAEFQNCFTGEAPVECGPGCSLVDLDPDDDIDLSDFTDFHGAFDASYP